MTGIMLKAAPKQFQTKVYLWAIGLTCSNPGQRVDLIKNPKSSVRHCMSVNVCLWTAAKTSRFTASPNFIFNLLSCCLRAFSLSCDVLLTSVFKYIVNITK